MSSLCPDIAMHMVSMSQIPLLYVWAQVCHATRAEAAKELRNRHKDLLGRFFNDVTQFLNFLRTVHAVVGGSLGLEYFEGWGLWTTRNCDIYVPRIGFANAIRFVQTREGYIVDNGADAQRKGTLIRKGPETVCRHSNSCIT